MKNLTRIFMVAMALFAYSCVTDTTEDLGVQLGANGQSEIALSLEESRTHINGKAGEVYPLYWSKGDQIAVNGIASEPLTEEAHGKAATTFKISGGLNYPLSIVYPAPAKGTVAAEGMQVVTFQATQNYTVGSFAEGAVPMYAYVATANEYIKLQHLAGVLCFAIKGEGKTLTSMTLKSESGAIAGNFDLNCADGTLTAQADATNVVTVSFGEGLTLSAEATPIYVAVPAGDYGIFAITLNTATDRMSIRFDSEGAKAVKPGVIREFAEFEYAANVAEDGAFLIESKEDLIQFAKIASNFEPYTSAKVVANVDMTGYDWTPIEGFDSAFDGGNFEIKGLTAPLFDETAATEIKNVKLVDVNIVESERTYFGALACKITSTEAVVENCSVSGAITANLSTDKAHITGLFDTSASTKKFSNLTSDVKIKITGKITDQLYAVGGMFSHSGELENVKNLSSIEYAGTECPDLRIGGVVQTCKNITECQNGSPTDKSKGALIVNGTCGPIRIGGIAALATSGTMTKCVNYGKIYTTENSNSKQIFMGGICGLSQNATTTYIACENNGELAIEQSIVNASGPRVGGFIGQIMTSGTLTITDGFINRGAININPKDCLDNIQVAGFVANYSTDITTASTGIILNEGDITYSGTATKGITRIAGIAAASSKAFPHEALTFVNAGDITVTGTAPTLTVGGIYGNSGKKLVNARCFCNIKATTTTSVGMIEVGSYNTTYPLLSCHAGGTIQIGDGEKITLDSSNYYEYLQTGVTSEIAVNNRCGYISSIDAIPQIAPLTISDAASLKAFAEIAATATTDISIAADINMTGEAWTPIEGFAGNIHGNGKTITGLTAPLCGTISGSISDLNLKDVDIEITDIKAEYAALACRIDNVDAVVRDCSISGKMKINLNMEAAITDNGKDKDIDIAGFVGYTTSTKKFSNLTSELDIEISGTYKNNMVVAGLVTYGIDCSLEKSQHLGTITYNGSSNGHVFIGGLVHECKEIVDCVNGSADDTTYTKGSMTLDGKTKNAYLAGLLPSGRSTATFVRCYNYGAITYTANAVTGGTTLPAGAMGYFSPSTAIVTFDTCANYAPITVDGSTIGGDLKVGGLVGHYGGGSNLKVLNGYTNAGEINIAPKSVAASKSVQIGGMIGNFSASFSTESTGRLHNKGNITYSGASSSGSTVRIAGILAAMAKNPPTDLELVNTGNLTSTGTGKTVNVGGILGAGKSVENAICYCSIKAVNVTTMGWIMAAARSSSVIAKNCKIGGNIFEYDEDDDIYTKIAIPESEFQNYIYSSRDATDWTGTDNYDGCTYLSSMPNL